VSTDDDLDLANARRVLDRDHYDIDKVKERILEFLAVQKLNPNSGSSILCFVGPPGVGKTSLGKSIAAAMGREFQRMSVGGVRDESEIRGHRRTYVGAMPGTIVRALRDAGSNNPVLMIDEIDKMGADFRGDPSSAMLEVLDPEQNSSFRDHYLDLPFDLSRVMFVTTANQLEPIPAPLRDRMETIQLAGYTEEEKLEIAKRYLVGRQVERAGLDAKKVEITDEALRELIDGYTREAGVRNLEREIGAVCRKIALRQATGGGARRRVVRPTGVRDMLGRRWYLHEVTRRTSAPGVATGLAWTPAGGEVLFVEATAFPGKGGLRITGQLGDVMRESAEAALSYVKATADGWGAALPDAWFQEHDIHVHVPAGAIPKDGPSAGITMAAALVSLATGRATRSDTAMTGELTLAGKVLPIGGLKEKALAAQRAEIGRVVAPRLNQADLEDIPSHLRGEMEFVFVDTIDRVFEEVLEQKPSRARPGRRPLRISPERAAADSAE
jgi:ATP-dependent Lon protease